MRIALTGATGFVGGALLPLAIAAGHDIAALTRRAQPARPGVRWIEGALDDAAALDRLVAGTDAAIHVAGVVNAPDRTGFAAGNVAGTQAMLDAASRAGVPRFVHVSSLAAREPQLSDYGWSKAEAETRVAASGLDWDMVRPPAIYGPGDREMLELFRLARYGLALLPPAGRLSAIHVDDLARLLLALAEAPAHRMIYEVDDGRDDAWSHRDFARAIGTAVGRRVLALSLPPGAMRLGARIDRRLRGARARLTADRVAYFCHPDWTVDPVRRPPADLWTPEIDTREGLARTAAAYRASGWL